AVERKIRTRRKTGLVRGEPGHHRGDFLRAAQALDGYGADDLLEHVRPDGADDVGADVARRYRIDGDALARHFLRQRHGEPVYPGLGGGIVGLPELPLLAIDRADVDDAPPLALDHVVDDLLGHVEQAVQVGVDDRPPIIQGHLAKQPVSRDPRVVDQHIDRPVLGTDFLERLYG